MHHIPVVTIVAFISTGSKVYIAGTVPDGKSSITDVVSIILESKRLIGDSENIIPGIGLPVDPFVPSVDAVLQLFSSEFVSSGINKVIVALCTSNSDFSVLKKFVVSQLGLVNIWSFRNEFFFIGFNILKISEVGTCSIVETNIEEATVCGGKHG